MPKPRFARRNNFRKPRFDKSRPTTSNLKNEYHHQNQLKEEDVGITQYISEVEGYSAVIKARFSDFQVNEIDLEGKVAKLTNQEIPKDFHVKNEKSEEPPVESALPQIPQEVWDGLRDMLQSSEEKAIELDATNLSKEQRTEIHECLRTTFSRKINATSVATDDKKTMVFKKFDPKTDQRSPKWPKDKGDFVHFLVYKECMDTLDTALKIAHCLRMQAANFAYAGVKDKRAKTTQWFSVWRVEPWKLIVKTKGIRNIRVGNITFKDHPLKLGDLKGNKFRIALRNVAGSDELIERSLQSLKERGFINYFGLQRFGNDKEVPTFAIGVQLLLGNWKEACKIILKVTESDRPDLDITVAKKVYAATGDAEKALEKFDDNRRTCVEYLLLEGLSKGHKNDFVNALPCIPRNTRSLYLHSFQSLIWNMVASKRVEKFGLEVVEGDLVFLEEEEDEMACEDEEEKKSQEGPKVKALTSEDCSNYTIYDVILPLPGYDVTYPKHMEEFYKECLEKHGLNLEMTQQKVKEYSVSGTYRKLFGRVQDVSWKIMHYNDPNSNLIRSDLEELRGQKDPEDVPGGAYKALILEFCLESASYATMVLREILKTDTSSSAQALLNNYHSAPPSKIQTKEIADNNDNEDCSEKIGLLEDAEKFAAFKSLVFNEETEEETTLKRKHEEEAGEGAKVARIEANGS